VVARVHRPTLSFLGFDWKEIHQPAPKIPLPLAPVARADGAINVHRMATRMATFDRPVTIPALANDEHYEVVAASFPKSVRLADVRVCCAAIVEDGRLFRWSHRADVREKILTNAEEIHGSRVIDVVAKFSIAKSKFGGGSKREFPVYVVTERRTERIMSCRGNVVVSKQADDTGADGRLARFEFSSAEAGIGTTVSSVSCMMRCKHAPHEAVVRAKTADRSVSEMRIPRPLWTRNRRHVHIWRFFGYDFAELSDVLWLEVEFPGVRAGVDLEVFLALTVF